jgi:hypothetical protein
LIDLAERRKAPPSEQVVASWTWKAIAIRRVKGNALLWNAITV